MVQEIFDPQPDLLEKMDWQSLLRSDKSSIFNNANQTDDR